MKAIIRNLLAAMVIAASIQTHAQGLVYDQQSASVPIPTQTQGVDGLNIQEDQPLAQSFIPSLSAIGFAQLEFWDIPNNGNNGATVYVNLWTGSPDLRSGFNSTLLGSTAPVYMPNGFGAGSGPAGVGVTNFYFSTPITLTAGQTYYLQPIVQSGDDPWDIITIGNTYPNGQVFEDGGGFSTDFWFREGVVPEPSTLALVGLSGLLVYALKRRFKPLVLLLFTASVLPVYSAQDSVVQVTADAAGLTRVSSAILPSEGTFWIMKTSPDGDIIGPPYPFLPPGLSAVPTYWVTNDIFIVDDTGGQLMPASAGRLSSAQAAATMQAQATTIANLIERIQNPPAAEEFRRNGFTPMFDMSGLWLEASNENNGYLGLRAQNTIGGDNYQLLSTTNLLNTNWDLGQILFGASAGYADFSPVPMTNAATFFRAHQANPAMEIVKSQYAIEPNPTNSDPGQVGIFYIYEEGSATNDVTVYYTIGGTAQNGIDYSNLTGVATVPLNQGYTEIDIAPSADGLKPNQIIILTLLQDTNYLIDPVYYSATNTLYANPQVYPIVSGDNEPVCPNTPWTFNLASDAYDPRGLTLTYSILTWPTHGTLDTNSLPSVTYTPTNCYEGQDSFTFQVSDGEYPSTDTVTLNISDAVSASSPTAQTCRGTPSASFSLGSDNCSETLGYVLLSSPANGTLSGTAANLTYTPTGTNFTGTDSFNYVLYSACGGDSATGTVTITVGDPSIYPTSRTLITGTNQPLTINLTTPDNSDPCNADTNYYIYTVISGPTNGTLGGSGANLTYTNNINYEGLDSFQFTVSDGVWSNAATITIAVTAGPILFQDCNPFSTAVLLAWMLDTNEQVMFPDPASQIIDFIVYRSASSGGPHTRPLPPITTPATRAG
jgi:hypothetical protein